MPEIGLNNSYFIHVLSSETEADDTVSSASAVKSMYIKNKLNAESMGRHRKSPR